MKASAQHIALLTALGWTHRTSVADLRYGHAKDWCDLDQVPELTLDLMQEAILSMTDDEQHAVNEWLYLNIPHSWHVFMATKEQRREAFLRVKGLWAD